MPGKPIERGRFRRFISRLNTRRVLRNRALNRTLVEADVFTAQGQIAFAAAVLEKYDARNRKIEEHELRAGSTKAWDTPVIRNALEQKLNGQIFGGFGQLSKELPEIIRGKNARPEHLTERIKQLNPNIRNASEAGAEAKRIADELNRRSTKAYNANFEILVLSEEIRAKIKKGGRELTESEKRRLFDLKNAKDAFGQILTGVHGNIELLSEQFN